MAVASVLLRTHAIERRTSDGRKVEESALFLSFSSYRASSVKNNVSCFESYQRHTDRDRTGETGERDGYCVSNMFHRKQVDSEYKKSVPPTSNFRGCFLGYSWDAQARRPRWQATRVTLGNSILCGASQETTKSPPRRVASRRAVRVCTEPSPSQNSLTGSGMLRGG